MLERAFDGVCKCRGNFALNGITRIGSSRITDDAVHRPGGIERPAVCGKNDGLGLDRQITNSSYTGGELRIGLDGADNVGQIAGGRFENRLVIAGVTRRPFATARGNHIALLLIDELTKVIDRLRHADDRGIGKARPVVRV